MRPEPFSALSAFNRVPLGGTLGRRDMMPRTNMAGGPFATPGGVSYSPSKKSEVSKKDFLR